MINLLISIYLYILYRASHLLAIDCEMDRVKTFMNNMNIPNKVSIINEDGEIVLDTLVRPYVNGIDYQDVNLIVGHGSVQ